MIEMNGDLPQLPDIYRMLAWAIGPAVLALFIVALLRLRRWLRGDNRPSDQVARTRLGRLSGGLPLDVSLIAASGTRAPAHDTLGELFLRPSWGLRLVTFGLPIVGFYLVQQTYARPGIFVGTIDIVMLGIVITLMLYALLYVNIYELRYDRLRFAHRNWRFQYKEHNWKDLTDIREDGGYFFVLYVLPRGKVYVPKHLTGIEDFVAKAQAQIAENTKD